MTPGRSAAAVRTLRPGLVLLESEVDDFDVRAVVVLGSDAALVWDALAHPDAVRPAEGVLGGRPFTLVYSHGDWDHVWGTAGLPRPGEIVAHAACAPRFDAELPAELDARRRAEPDRWDEVRLVPPDRVFDGAVVVDLGGVSVRLEALSGHTPDCAVAWIPEWGVLLAGDTVETPLPVVNDGAAVPGWVGGLRRWVEDPGVRLVVPSHGRIGDVEVVRETLDYLERLSTGGAMTAPDGAPPFYGRTHADNLRRMARAR